LRCVRPDLSSNPDGARRLIIRYRENPIPAIGNVRPEKSQISDTEIPKREKSGEKNDDDDQSKLDVQLASKRPVVVVASSWPGANPPKLLRSSLKS
jgi:hypothetical protein